MKKLTAKYFHILILFFFCGLSSCYKTDNPPQLEIQVLDTAGHPVAGAYVALFDSYQNWKLRENPVQTWRSTDSEGYVLFIDLFEIEYYFYVRIDSRDNSYHEMKTDGNLKINEKARVKVHLD